MPPTMEVVPDRQEKRAYLKQMFDEMCEKPRCAGDTWYLLHKSWWLQLDAYLNNTFTDESLRPGPIDNSPILKDDGEARSGLKGNEYRAIPEGAWILLQDTFGLRDGQRPVAGKVIHESRFMPKLMIEYNLLEFELAQYSQPLELCKAKFSRADTIEFVAVALRSTFSINDDAAVRVWSRDCEDGTYEELDDFRKTVNDFGLYGVEVLIIEVQNSDKTWPRDLDEGRDPFKKSRITFFTERKKSRASLPAIEVMESENPNRSSTESFITVSSCNEDDEDENNNGSAHVEKECSNAASPQTDQSAPPSYEAAAAAEAEARWAAATPWAEATQLDQQEDEVRVHNSAGGDGVGVVAPEAALQDDNGNSTSPPQQMVQPNSRKDNDDNEVIGGASRYNFRERRTKTVPATTSSSSVVSDENARPGLCGLFNLGSTCFMNSTIQGLSNCPPIAKYFSNNNYADDINEDNELGTKGAIANSFGRLIQNLWQGGSSWFEPNDFKDELARFAPQFSGNQQQDSQELLVFLLDGLHEDLRRPPNAEQQSATNDCSSLVQSTVWETFRKNNDSIIKDLFECMIRSTVQCSSCPRHSVTYEPVFSLSLPIPCKRGRPIQVFLFYKDPTKRPQLFTIILDHESTTSDLFLELSRVSNVDPNAMMVGMIENRQLVAAYGPNRLHVPVWRVQQGSERKVLVYEVHRDDRTDLVVVHLREVESGLNFGMPFFINPPKGTTTYRLFYQLVIYQLNRCLNVESEAKLRSLWIPKSTNAAEENGVEEENEQPFGITFVNRNGDDIGKPVNDGNPLDLAACNFVALDWPNRTKELYFNEEEALNWEHGVNSVSTTLSLEDCLQLYTNGETLSGDNAWFCEDCQEPREATKRLGISSLPPLLVIHLKRFSYERGRRNKLSTRVNFPIENLDMSPFVVGNDQHGPVLYDLVAVSNHYGDMNHGHYTTYAKHQDDHRWYNFDDTNVTEVKESDVVSEAAYVLFYNRKYATI